MIFYITFHNDFFTHKLNHRVQLTKLAKLDGNICSYLTALMVAALSQVGEVLVIPEGTHIATMIREVFENMFLKEDNHNYENHINAPKCPL